jgi:hypothetical protein
MRLGAGGWGLGWTLPALVWVGLLSISSQLGQRRLPGSGGGRAGQMEVLFIPFLGTHSALELLCRPHYFCHMLLHHLTLWVLGKLEGGALYLTTCPERVCCPHLARPC